MADSQTALSGLKIVLTRPADRLEGISAAIRRAGGTAVSLPLIRIEPLVSAADEQRIKDRILQLDRYQMVIFVSTNAANIGMDWVDRYWPQLPQGLEAFTVGPGTAEVLSQWHWPVHFPEQGVTSEALLALPALQSVRDRNVLLFRGQGGRELITGTLRERGAVVDHLELYRRLTPVYPAEVLRERLAGGSHAIVVTSAQILEALVNCLSQLQSASESRKVKALPLLVPSARVQKLARDHGFSHVVDAGGASDRDVIQCLTALFGE